MRTKGITHLIKPNRQNKPQLPKLSEFWLTTIKVWLRNHTPLFFSRNSFVWMLAWVLWLIAWFSSRETTVSFTETSGTDRVWEEAGEKGGERRAGGGSVFVNTSAENIHLRVEVQVK